TVATYLRLDDASKGYYTGWLRLGTAAIITGVVVGLLSLFGVFSAGQAGERQFELSLLTPLVITGLVVFLSLRLVGRQAVERGSRASGPGHGVVPRAGVGVAKGGPPHPRPARRRNHHRLSSLQPVHWPVRGRAWHVWWGLQLLPDELDQAKLPLDDVPVWL